MSVAPAPVSNKFGRLSRRQQKLTIQISSLAVVAILWEIVGRQLGVVLFAPLSEIIPAYIDLAIGGPMFPELLGSLGEMLIGYGLAVAFAVPLGLMMGRIRTVEKLVDPWVSAMFVTSTTSLLPLLVLAFGIDISLRIVVVWLACVWHILINVFHGARQVDESYIDVGRSFDTSSLQTFGRITLPAIAPYVFTGLRMGLSRAIRGIILAETYILVGYGGLIASLGRQTISTAPVLALIITLMILGALVIKVLSLAQGYFFPWANV